MSIAANKTFIRQYLDAVSGREKTPPLLNQFVADEQLAQHIAVMEAAFPRYEITAEDILAEDDRVAVRAIFRGTHGGEFMGIAPTQRQVSLPFIIIYRVGGEKIVEHWISVDMLSLMQQLGAIPAPAGAAG
jgi:predicted ester cyclase